MICCFWVLNHGFKFQKSVCNGCHDLTMLSVYISNIAIITVTNTDYRCIINNIPKSEAINLFIKRLCLKSLLYIKNIILNFNLLKTVGFFYFFCLVYIKWLILSTSVSL